MKSHATFKGHPIHPMLVTLPIGLWVTSLVCDIIYFANGGLFWHDMAWWTMAFGVVGALLAAIPGLVDYNTTIQRSERVKPTARRHMVLNLAIVGIYVVNLFLRWNYGAADGPLLGAVALMSLIAVGMLAYSGYLGGHMVYHYGVGMRRDDLRISMMETEEAEAKLPRR